MLLLREGQGLADAAGGLYYLLLQGKLDVSGGKVVVEVAQEETLKIGSVALAMGVVGFVVALGGKGRLV